jgi:dihydrolipoamide dehydrogenase
MAHAWSTLGSRVAIVEAEERLLPTEEPFAGEQLAEAMQADGVDIHVGVSAVRASRDGEVELELDDGTVLGGEQLLVAVGRRPRTDDLGLESVGIEPGGYLEVDDQMRVGGRDWLYSIGDANGRSLLTHMGTYQGRIAGDHILGAEGVAVSADDAGSPRVVFTDPQVAAVGATLADAAKEGINARAVDVTTAGTAGASFYGRNTEGTTRMVVDEDRGVIVGMTFVGFATADFLHAATIAIIGEVPLSRLSHAVPAFPTRSEIWLKLIEAYGL